MNCECSPGRVREAAWGLTLGTSSEHAERGEVPSVSMEGSGFGPQMCLSDALFREVTLISVSTALGVAGRVNSSFTGNALAPAPSAAVGYVFPMGNCCFSSLLFQAVKAHTPGLGDLSGFSVISVKSRQVLLFADWEGKLGSTSA